MFHLASSSSLSITILESASVGIFNPFLPYPSHPACLQRAGSCCRILCHTAGRNRPSAPCRPCLLFLRVSSLPASCHRLRYDCSSLLCVCKIQWLHGGVFCALQINSVAVHPLPPRQRGTFLRFQ